MRLGAGIGGIIDVPGCFIISLLHKALSRITCKVHVLTIQVHDLKSMLSRVATPHIRMMPHTKPLRNLVQVTGTLGSKFTDPIALTMTH